MYSLLSSLGGIFVVVGMFLYVGSVEILGRILCAVGLFLFFFSSAMKARNRECEQKEKRSFVKISSNVFGIILPFLALSIFFGYRLVLPNLISFDWNLLVGKFTFQMFSFYLGMLFTGLLIPKKYPTVRAIISFFFSMLLDICLEIEYLFEPSLLNTVSLLILSLLLVISTLNSLFEGKIISRIEGIENEDKRERVYAIYRKMTVVVFILVFICSFVLEFLILKNR